MIRAIARLAGVALAALLLLAMQRTTPGYSEITGPLSVHGAMGETVAARSFTMRAEKVILAETIRWRAYGRDHERSSAGRWAVVIVQMEAMPQSATVLGASWSAPSGRIFAASARTQGAPSLLVGNRLEPGLPKRGILIFELPREDIAGGTLLVSAARFPRLDSQLHIPLTPDRLENADALDLAGLADG